MTVGAIIVCSFAVVWAAAGAGGLSRRWFAILLATSVAVSAAIIFAATRIRPGHVVQFNAKAYYLSVVFEAIFITLAVVFLTRTDRKYLLLPAISVVVGLHFFGMVWALASNEYWWIGVAMCCLPIVTVLALPRQLWKPVVGFGCAIVLWASVVWALF